MKNLELVRRRYVRLQLAEEEQEKIVSATVDSDHDRAFFLSDACRLYWTSLVSCNQLQHSMSLEGAMQPGSGTVAVAGMEYILELEALAIGMESGDLLLVQFSSGHVEVVGTLQGGIRAMAASPDGELLAIATGFGQLLLMTPDWDTLYEFSLRHPGSNGEQQDVCGVTISWRPDGRYFATSEYSRQDSSNVIKIWDRETGKLYSRSDALPSSGTAFTWCPGGARLAASTFNNAEGLPTITIIEKNGLKKDRFQLTAPSDAKIESLKWDSSGDILQVLIRSNGWDAVQLWNCSNYHWYLKQEWRYSSDDGVNMLWHPEKALSALTWTVSGSVSVIALGWRSAVICGASSAGLVIDGPNILVTPLAFCVIPPPLHLFKVRFPAPVNGITLTSDISDSSTMAATLSNGKVALAMFPTANGWSQLENSTIEGSILQNFDGSLRNLTHFNVNTYCGLIQSCHQTEELVEIRLSRLGEDWNLQSYRQIPLDKPVTAVARRLSSDFPEVFIQLEDGNVLKFLMGALETTVAGKFPTSCPWMQVAEANEKTNFIGLDEHGKLHVGNALINSDCNGFALHIASAKSRPDIIHLIYTTRQDYLHVINLENLSGSSELLDVSGSGKLLPAQKDFNVQRVWERGARVVATLGGSDVAVILQTARGNLETIYPRGLILQAIAAALADHNFKEAIICARRHRIDLNVLVDFLGEDKFSGLASEFVKQVGKLNLVMELVSCLKKEDVLEATYQKTLSTLNPDKKVASTITGNKVQVVLAALRDAVEKGVPDSPSKELCLLTILARNDPPLLEEALKRIKALRERELGFEDGEVLEVGILPEKLSAEGALKHLIWLVDANAVFNAALGLYDLHLAAMVASHSQRDPKEFLPFLQELEDMPNHIMRYKIDCKLHRYENALKDLSCAGDAYFDEVLELVKSHPELFPVAISIFTDKGQTFSLLEAWGDYFLEQEKFEDAAISFCSCSNLHKALNAYRAGGLWQGVLMVAGQLNMPADQTMSLASDLREELQAMGRPKEAARIALDYCKDLEGAVSLLIEARDWIEVLRLCYLHSRPDLVERLVEPAAVDCSNGLINHFEEGIEKVGKYCARYSAVRQRRLLLEAKLKADEVEDRVEYDTASEASSNLSGMSVYTRGTARSAATGKTRARRQGRIRAGSPGEELALAEHLNSMAISTQLAEELRCLLQVLVFMKREDISCRLQKLATKFREAQAEAVRLTSDAEQRSTINLSSGWSYKALDRAA